MLFGHGDDAYMYNKKSCINFSSNVYYGGLNQGLKQHLIEALDLIGSYPEVIGETVIKKIAAYHGVKEQNVVVTSGATSAFYLIAQTFAGGESTIFSPSFAEYEDACNANQHNIEFISRDKFITTELMPEGMVWLCNPNNPDGKLLNADSIIKRISENQSVQFVIDEAYIDFTAERDKNSVIPYIDRYSNVIVVRSLTKNIAIPGLRLGYIIASDYIVEGLLERIQPWSVNTLALKAGEYYFDNINDFKIDTDALLRDTTDLINEINEIDGFRAHKTDASFFLIEIASANSKDLKSYLIDKHDILVRDASNFRLLDSSCIRVATQNRDNNKKLITALKQWSCR
jgi:threonine-phosphate decarboxylase